MAPFYASLSLFLLYLAPLLANPFEAVIYTVAAAKDVLHIDEWIDYHRVLGYMHFYILDTDGVFSYLATSRDDHVTILSTDTIEFTLRDRYAAFTANLYDEPTTCSFLSVSDFIVLRNYSTIQELHSSIGPTALHAMPVFEVYTNENDFYPDAILKRMTLKSRRPTSIRYSAVLSDIVDFNHANQPILKSSQALLTFQGNATEASAVVFSSTLLTRQEHRWYVEWLCGTYPTSILGVVGSFDSRDYSGVCSSYHQLRETSAVGQRNYYSDSSRSDSLWMRWFDSYYDSLRSEYKQGDPVEDTAAWMTYSSLLNEVQVSDATTEARNSENEPFYRQLILSDERKISSHSEDFLLSLPMELRTADLKTKRRTLVLYQGSDLDQQIIQFCVDYVLSALHCHVLAQNAINLIGELPVTKLQSTESLDVDRLQRLLTYYQSIVHPAPSPLMKLRWTISNLTRLHHREECYRGWREGETMLLRLPEEKKMLTRPTMPSFLMYVIHHDDASEQMLKTTLFPDSSVNNGSDNSDRSGRSGNGLGNGLIVPVRVRSSVFFEYLAYREVLPERYLSEWSDLQYVGISTYKTVVQYEALCTYDLQRLLRVGMEKDYDVIPFVRSNHDVMVRTVLNHGRGFRYAWDAVLTALGYNETTIRRYDLIKPFYRNSMFIKPSWLMRLSQFMSRAIEVVQYNSTLYELCSVDAKYERNVEVSQRIFNATSYQMFPFVYERLTVFFLMSEGALICQGNNDCPYNDFWY